MLGFVGLKGESLGYSSGAALIYKLKMPPNSKRSQKSRALKLQKVLNRKASRTPRDPQKNQVMNSKRVFEASLCYFKSRLFRAF